MLASAIDDHGTDPTKHVPPDRSPSTWKPGLSVPAAVQGLKVMIVVDASPADVEVLEGCVATPEGEVEDGGAAGEELEDAVHPEAVEDPGEVLRPAPQPATVAAVIAATMATAR